jgi:hypothetical protein
MDTVFDLESLNVGFDLIKSFLRKKGKDDMNNVRAAGAGQRPTSNRRKQNYTGNTRRGPIVHASDLRVLRKLFTRREAYRGEEEESHLHEAWRLANRSLVSLLRGAIE